MNNRQAKFSFNFYPKNDSETGILLRYLRDCPDLSGLSTKEKILQALKAYWFPLAVNSISEDQDEIRNVALSSVNQLYLQIQYLQNVFKLTQTIGIVDYGARRKQVSINQVESINEKLEDQLEEVVDSSAEEDFLKYF